jgi:hypothetical protein
MTGETLSQPDDDLPHYSHIDGEPHSGELAIAQNQEDDDTVALLRVRPPFHVTQDFYAANIPVPAKVEEFVMTPDVTVVRITVESSDRHPHTVRPPNTFARDLASVYYTKL